MLKLIARKWINTADRSQTILRINREHSKNQDSCYNLHMILINYYYFYNAVDHYF